MIIEEENHNKNFLQQSQFEIEEEAKLDPFAVFDNVEDDFDELMVKDSGEHNQIDEESPKKLFINESRSNSYKNNSKVL